MIPERVDRKKLYIFDLGGVTLDNVDIRPEWLSQIKVDKDEFYHTYNEYIWPIMDGTITTESFYRHLESYFGIKIEGEPFLEYFHPVLNHDVVDTIKRLREDGNRVVTGTNNCTPHWEYIKKKGWNRLFDACYPSQEIKLSKPYSSFYNYILEKENYCASDAVMIDDGKENIEGAKRVGMKAFLLTPEFDRKKLYSSLLSIW